MEKGVKHLRGIFSFKLTLTFLRVCLVLIMVSSSSHGAEKSPEPMDPATFSLLKQMSDSIAALTARMATMEARQPLASAFEQGGQSTVQQRGPLPDQRAAFEAATMAQQRGPAQHAPPPPPPPLGHRYGYEPNPNSPLHRNVVPPI